MSVDQKEVMISDSIRFTSIVDPKFKTNNIYVYFTQLLQPHASAAGTLAFSLLLQSNQRFPSSTDLTRHLNNLYDAFLSQESFSFGDGHLHEISVSVLADCYALQQEPLLEEGVNLLCDCLFRPHLEGNGFSAEDFAIKQRDQLAAIEAEINNRRGYALHQCSRMAFVDEPAAHSVCGTREEVLALTPESVYAAYQKILRTAPIQIIFIGPEPQPQLADRFAQEFAALDRSSVQQISLLAPSPVKAVPMEKTESLPVSQCKLVLAFKSAEENRYVASMFNTIYGGSPLSKLFRNVREKLSLCYYCASSYSNAKATFLVDCGVETRNIETAKAEILRQLEELCQGNLSEEELDNAKQSICNALKSKGDSPKSYASGVMMDTIYPDSPATTEERIEIYQSITREQIMQAARKLTLDAVYLMLADESEVPDADAE